MRATLLTLLVAGTLIGLATTLPRAQEPRPRGPGGPGGPGGRGGMPGGFPPLPILTALDADGDGVISTKEIDNAPKALRTLDKNKDGKLTRDEILPEFRPGGPAGPNAAELVDRMMAFDANKDGKLSKDELPERMQGLMDRADANKDGFIDKAELTRHAEQLSRRGRGEGPLPGRGAFIPRDGGPGAGEGPGPDRESRRVD